MTHCKLENVKGKCTIEPKSSICSNENDVAPVHQGEEQYDLA